jgi:carbamoyl-phosphate synthase small subunit
MDLAKVVSVAEPYEWTGGEWTLAAIALPAAPHLHVVAYDFGVKHNILRMLAARGCRVTVVPAQTSAAEVLKCGRTGVFLSNGPGDPEPCDYAITAIRELLAAGLPTFGICLGHQLLALASGRQDDEDEVRPSRCQPPGQGSADRAGADHQPEPRLCRGRR